MTSKLTITDERLAELVAFKPLPSTDINSATRDEWMAMAAELHERRKADSEPNRNPVLAYADSYRDMAKQGVESVPIWSVITDLERNIAPLYRHAQPAPVVSFYRDGIEAAAKWIDKQREAYDSEHGWSDPDTGAFEFGNDAQRDYSSTLEELAEGIRALHPNAGNSPVIPDGYVMVPKEPTERMVIDGFESEPDETFSEPEVWEAFQKMSGCEQAAFRARLCWAAMLAAAPQEVPDGK